MKLPLQGIKVLDLSAMLPGPYCSMVLADFGAEVIKIEPPKGGDLFRWTKPMLGDTGGVFLQVNRNKKSVSLNLKSETGKEIFYKLAAEADVVIEQFRPGVVKRLGIDYNSVKAVNPHIIYCSISGYGQDGPYSQMSGHDINYISYAGILGMTARKDQVPTLPGVQIADMGGGTFNSVIGILLALMGREQNGQGQYVDISMLDGAVSWLPLIASDYFVTGITPKPRSGMLTGRNACYEIYETKDGGFISLGAVEPHLWANFCDYLGKDEFKEWQRVIEKQDEMFSYLRAMFRTKTRAEWEIELKDVDACWAPVLGIDEVFANSQVLSRNMLLEMDHPRLGKIKQIGSPIKLSDTPARAELSPPDRGQHTSEYLLNLGYSANEISNLKEAGII
jgi:Predicted acyl-CoA transferases/carnitine dehydratase